MTNLVSGSNKSCSRILPGRPARARCHAGRTPPNVTPQPVETTRITPKSGGFLYVSNVESAVPQTLVDKMFDIAKGTFAIPEEDKPQYREDADRLGWGDQRRGKVDLAKRKEDEGDFKALGGTEKGEIDSSGCFNGAGGLVIPELRTDSRARTFCLDFLVDSFSSIDRYAAYPILRLLVYLIREQYQFSKFGPGSHDTHPSRRHPPAMESSLVEIEEWTRRCNGLAKQIASAIARGLGLPSDYFDAMHGYSQKSGDQYRWMLYHPVPSEHNNAASLRLAGHHDIGTLTLLFQNGVGGLQAQSPTGYYYDVPPKPGCVTVNLGTVMEVLCGHAGLKATKHRVAMNEGSTPRYSIAHFSYPGEFPPALYAKLFMLMAVQRSLADPHQARPGCLLDGRRGRRQPRREPFSTGKEQIICGSHCSEALRQAGAEGRGLRGFVKGARDMLEFLCIRWSFQRFNSLKAIRCQVHQQTLPSINLCSARKRRFG